MMRARTTAEEQEYRSMVRTGCPVDPVSYCRCARAVTPVPAGLPDAARRPMRRACWHQRSCFVADSRIDAAFPRAADRDRLAQLRIVALLDRCVEGIHVDVDDFARPARSRRDVFAQFASHFRPLPMVGRATAVRVLVVGEIGNQGRQQMPRSCRPAVSPVRDLRSRGAALWLACVGGASPCHRGRRGREQQRRRAV